MESSQEQSSTVIICCGINRSGSTWVYQVMQELNKEKEVTDLGFIDSDLTSLEEAITSGDEIILVKMHNHTSSLKDKLDGQNVKLIYSHRDLRGSVLSLMKKTSKPFEKVYLLPFFKDAVESLSDWQSYGDIHYIDYRDIKLNGSETVRGIASYLEQPENQADTIADKFSMKNQKKRINNYRKSPKVMWQIVLHKLRLRPMPKDEKSLLHFNHIQSGQLEEWREVLNEEQSQLILSTYMEWMTFFSYGK